MKQKTTLQVHWCSKVLKFVYNLMQLNYINYTSIINITISVENRIEKNGIVLWYFCFNDNNTQITLTDKQLYFFKKLDFLKEVTFKPSSFLLVKPVSKFLWEYFSTSFEIPKRMIPIEITDFHLQQFAERW